MNEPIWLVKIKAYNKIMSEGISPIVNTMKAVTSTLSDVIDKLKVLISNY